MNYPRRGEVYWTELDPSRGAEIRKTRPCLIIGDDDITRRRRTVIVIPISATTPQGFPLHVALPSISSDSQAVVDQMRAADPQRLLAYITTVTLAELEQVGEALAWVLGLLE